MYGFRLHSLTMALWMVFPRLMSMVNAVGSIEEYCETDVFHAECPEDHVIIVDSAKYGRMRRGRCVERDYGYVGCSKDVMNITDNWCSGKHTCTIPIPNSAFRSTQHSCPNDLKPYFETSYSCMRVVTGQGQRCQPGRHVTVTSQHSFLANIITADTQLGSEDCPWMIRVSPGQTINMTIWNFAMSYGYKTRGADVCQVMVVIRERSLSRGHTVCRKDERIRQVYITQTNEVEVRLLGDQSVAHERLKTFMLEFEAIGCPDLPSQTHMWMQRQGDLLEVGCQGLDTRWKLTCVAGDWIGLKPNCTKDLVFPGDVMLGSVVMPFEVSLVVIIAIALLIGVIILALGLLLLRWRIRSRRIAKAQRKNAPNETSHTLYDVKPVNSYTNNHTGNRNGYPAVPDYDVGGYTEENEYAYISEVLPPQSYAFGDKDAPSTAETNDNNESDSPVRHGTQPGNSSVPSGSGTRPYVTAPRRQIMQTFSNPGAQLLDESAGMVPQSPCHEQVNLSRSKNPVLPQHQTPIKNNVLPRLLAHECALNISNDTPQHYGATHINHHAVYALDQQEHRCNLPTYYELDPKQAGQPRMQGTTSPFHMSSNGRPAKVFAVQRHGDSM